MKKILFVIALLLGAAVNSSAQSSKDGGKFSIGLETGLPIADFNTTHSFAIGGSLKYDQPVAANTFITLSAGYSSFRGKKDIRSFGFVPVKAGIKYFFSEGFFGEGQIGAAFSTQGGAGGGNAIGGGTAIAYAPGLGYSFNNNIEAGVRYEAWYKDGTVSQIGLRLAYKF
ncbi:MAG: outer membrane beta-barrel protein [Bacteroidota bacterium]